MLVPMSYKYSPYPGEPSATSGSGVEPEERNCSRFEGLGHPGILQNLQGVAGNAGNCSLAAKTLGLHPSDRRFESCQFHYPSKEIKLTRGYVALVSPEDYERVAVHKWTAMPVKGKKIIYARRSTWGDDGKCHTVLLHRFIMQTPKGVLTDHWNGDGLDCRRYNLRPATYSQNSFNRRCKPSISGLIGVSSQTPDRWRGVIACEGKRVYTTTYPSPILAAQARDILARELHGEFAVLNFPVALPQEVRP